MMLQEAVNAVWVTFGLGIFFAVWQFGMKPAIEEVTRFKLTREHVILSDYAAEQHGKNFRSNPEYKKVSRLIAGHLKFVTALNGIHVAAILLLKGYWKKEAPGSFADDLKDQWYIDSAKRAGRLSFYGALAKSPIIALLMFAYFLLLSATGRKASIQEIVSKLSIRATPSFERMATVR